MEQTEQQQTQKPLVGRSAYEVDTTGRQTGSQHHLQGSQELRVLPLPNLGDMGMDSKTSTLKTSTYGRPASMYSINSGSTTSSANRPVSMHSMTSSGNRGTSTFTGGSTLTRPANHVSKSSGELKVITENETSENYPRNPPKYTHSIVDIYSEVNKRRTTNSQPQEHKNAKWYNTDSTPDIEYLKWVSETNNNNTNSSIPGNIPEAKLTPTDSSCSSTKSNVSVTKSDSDSSRSSKGGSTSSSSGVSSEGSRASASTSPGSSTGKPTSKSKSERNSSPDSGCEMSVMVAYTSEPRVRRPPGGEQTTASKLKPTPAPRQTLRKTRSESSKCTDGANLVTDEELSDQGSREEEIKSQENTKSSLSVSSSINLPRSNLELTCPYSRSGIYSLEGSRLQTELEQQTQESRYNGHQRSGGQPLERRQSELEQYSTSSGTGSSIMSSTGGTKLRSYASSRDILEMYGTIGGNNAANHNPPLSPRMLGFSSSDLRLPPSALLISLSGKKANSTMNVDWNQNSGVGGGIGNTPAAGGHPAKVTRNSTAVGMYHHNLATTVRRIERDTVF